MKGDQWCSLEGSWAAEVVEWWSRPVWDGGGWVREEEVGAEEKPPSGGEKEGEEDGGERANSSGGDDGGAPPSIPHRLVPRNHLLKILYSRTSASDELWLGNTLLLLRLVAFSPPPVGHGKAKNPVGDRSSAVDVEAVSRGDFNKLRLTAVDWSESAKNPRTVPWKVAGDMAEREGTAFARKVGSAVDGEEWEGWVKGRGVWREETKEEEKPSVSALDL